MRGVAILAVIAVALAQSAKAQSDLVGKALPTAPLQYSAQALEDTADLYDLSGVLRARAKSYLSNKYTEVSYASRGRHESEIYKSISPSVVIVVTDTGIGSGTYVGLGNNSLITNWHVVKGFKKVGLLFKPLAEGSKPSEADFEVAEVTKIDPTRDLALLQVATIPQNVKPIALGSEADIQVGADVHAIGHPTGEAWTYTKGFISQYRKDYEWKTEEGSHKASVIQTQTPINPGNSGGPLISDEGKLIGINAFKATGEALNFAVAIVDVQNFLAKSGVAPVKASSTCKSVKIYEGRDSQNVSRLVQYDTNCDGKADYSFAFPDEISKPFSVYLDTNFDGKTDVTVEDRNRDGQWDISFHDVDFDGTIDLVGYHADGKLTPTSFVKYVAGTRY
jgi:S1-C subfamily serine protease